MRMEYLEAEATLASAEADAWAARDFDTLSRLYMPLQETRRQRRQRCGEGVVRLDMLATGPEHALDPERIVTENPHGQLLVAGWGTIAPAVAVRRLAAERGLYVETFLGAVYPVGAGHAVVIVPLPETPPPALRPASIDQLMSKLPAHCLVMNVDELPKGSRRGTWETFAETMGMWERLHTPFLAAADMQVDPARKIEGYRTTTRVDYASELAHQKLSDVAKQLARAQRAARRA